MATKPKKANAAKSQYEAERSVKKVQKLLPVIMLVFVLIIFIVHPLFVDGTVYVGITKAKQDFFVVCSVLLFLTLLLISLITPGFYRRFKLKSFVRGIRPYEWALLAYAVVMGISTIFADYPEIAVTGASTRNEGLLMMLTYFGVCVLVGRFLKPKAWMMYALCGTAALVAVYGICQYYGSDFLGLYPAEVGAVKGIGQSFFSTMSNVNVASTYLCIAFCVSLVMFSNKTNKVQWVFLPIGMLLFYALLICRTESGYVGLVASIAIAFPFIISTRQAAARFFLMIACCLGAMWLETTIALTDGIFSGYWVFMKPYLLPAIGGLLALAAILYFVKLPKSLPVIPSRIVWYVLLVVLIVLFLSSLTQIAELTGNTSVAQLDNIMQGNLEDGYMSNRMMIWKRSVAMVPDRPLFGHGPDNFAQSFNDVNYDEVYAATGVVFDKLHNEYLQVLFDDGILGLLCLLGFYGSLLVAARKKLGNPMVIAIAVALLCHMFQAFFNFVSPFAHPIAWTMWGVLGALIYGNGQEKEKAKKLA